LKRRRIKKDLFISIIYGVILGICGNLFVDFFIEYFYFGEPSRFVAFCGMVLMLAVMIVGFYFTYQVAVEEAEVSE